MCVCESEFWSGTVAKGGGGVEEQLTFCADARTKNPRPILRSPPAESGGGDCANLQPWAILFVLRFEACFSFCAPARPNKSVV